MDCTVLLGATARGSGVVVPYRQQGACGRWSMENVGWCGAVPEPRMGSKHMQHVGTCPLGLYLCCYGAPDSLLTSPPVQKSPCAQKLQVLPYERMYGILQALQFFEKVGA